MFFKRRSRANSYLEETDSPTNKNFEKYERPPSSRRDSAAPVNGSHEPIAPIEKETQMYPRQSGPQEPFSPQRTMSGGHNAMPSIDPSHGGMGMPMSGGMHMKPSEPSLGAPDLLTRAFNEAVRPYTERIDQLEGQIAELNAWIETLEQQRAEVHSWIDKRGLRPGTINRFFSATAAFNRANRLQMSLLASRSRWIATTLLLPALSTRSLTARLPLSTSIFTVCRMT